MRPNLTQLLKQQSAPEDETWQPVFYRLSKDEDAVALEQLLSNRPDILIRDEIMLQLKDLVKLEHPQKTLTEEEYSRYILEKLSGQAVNLYGVWVYYPWKRELVHLLDEEEFIRVRTIRNAYKITFEEQAILRTKKVGVIGLSVGQSAALAIAMERIAGEIRLADFDHIELSNLNRLRTTTSSIRQPKSVIVAREIAEIDPFIKVLIFRDGINENNIREFLSSDNKLNCLIEECDSVEIKILARIVSRELGIPVVMDTSDGGLIDIERYDLNSSYPILHGLVDENISLELLKTLKTSEEKLPYMVPFSGLETLTKRMKASALELGTTISTWPQLSSDVSFGGVLCAIACREILLGNKVSSLRKWHKLTFCENSSVIDDLQNRCINDSVLNSSKLQSIDFFKLCVPTFDLTPEIFRQLAEAGQMAPSAGNLQKWKFIYTQGNIFLILNREESTKLAGDNRNIASYMSFGMVIENMILKAKSIGLNPLVKVFEESYDPVIARLNFEHLDENYIPKDRLEESISQRYTDRNSGIRVQLSLEEKSDIEKYTKSENCEIRIFYDDQSIKKIGEHITRSDRLRIMNQQAHHELFNLELQWENSDSDKDAIGIPIQDLRLKYKDEIGLRIARDYNSISFLKDIDKGNGLRNISKNQIESASGFALVYLKNHDKFGHIEAGRLIQRFWLKCTEMNIGFQPMSFSTMMFHLAEDNSSTILNGKEIDTLKKWQSEINSEFQISTEKTIVFIIRLHKNVIRPLNRRRLSLDQIMMIK